MANSYCTYCTFTVQIVRLLVASRKLLRISIFKIPKAKSGMPEHKNGMSDI